MNHAIELIFFHGMVIEIVLNKTFNFSFFSHQFIFLKGKMYLHTLLEKSEI